MSANLNIDKAKFDRDGYVIVKNVFTKDEVEEIRKKAYVSGEQDKQKNLFFKLDPKISIATYFKGDILSKPLLRHILFDDRIVQIAKVILGADPVYFGDSNYQIGTGARGYHRDNIDRTDITAPDWKGEYTIIRMGVYLQDHKKYSGGLKVRAGSHKNASGKSVFVDSEEGDVVIWNLKTMHSGNAVRLKFLPNLTINRAGIEGAVPGFLKKDQQKERIILFMTFGLKSNHLDRYIEQYMLKRKDVLEHLKSSKLDNAAWELAKQKRIEVLKIIPEYGG